MDVGILKSESSEIALLQVMVFMMLCVGKEKHLMNHMF